MRAAIEKVLEEVDVILGWERNEQTGMARPARFYVAADAARAVFDATCVHNLAVYLPRLKGLDAGIVVKACDRRAVLQLITEGEVKREKVRVIGVGCGDGGVIDVKSVWRRHGYGVAIDLDGGSLSVGGERVDIDDYLMSKCRECRGGEPVLRDEFVGEPARSPEAVAVGEVMAAAGTGPAVPGRAAGSGLSGAGQEFAVMTAVERREFWRRQFSRCIRCYACREACPMCYCRDVCAIQSSEPRWTGGGIDAKDAEMSQLIRVNHLAGRCTGCGECERACPVGIPLMLLMDEQNRIIDEMFGYRAGVDPEAKPPLLTFDVNADTWGES